MGIVPASGATRVNVFTCLDAEYYCANYGPTGITGYKGFDGPYHYDVDKSGQHIAHNCTSYVAFRVNKILGGIYDPAWDQLGDASSWAKNARVKLPYLRIDDVPEVGSIAQWGAVGHVAMVEYIQYNTDNSVDFIIISDDNYGLKKTSQRALWYKVNDGAISWPDYFIHFPLTGAGGGGGISRPPSPLSVTVTP